jgi:hypothetical protein
MSRGFVMGRINRWIRVGIVIGAAMLSLATASVAASASTGSHEPPPPVHVH